MARFGKEPGERGSLIPQLSRRGVVVGYFEPTDPPGAGASAAGVGTTGIKLVEVDPQKGQLVMHPLDTRSWSDAFLAPKYSSIKTIVLPVDLDEDEDVDLFHILEELPPGFTKDYEYGLGLAQDCDVIIDLIEESTACSRIQFTRSGDTAVAGDDSLISFAAFEELRRELRRIKNQGDAAIRRVKQIYTHNALAPVLGVKPRQLALGHLPTSQWMTKVAAGEKPLSDREADELLRATTASARELAWQVPASMVRLQRDVELVNLERLTHSFQQALGNRHDEPWWQQFFEENLFALQLLFGGPTAFVDAQVPIGEGGNQLKGKKIADYLFKHSMTNNASLVEIKTPATKLLKATPYRVGVYGVRSQIGEAVTQVLDQALHLTRHEDPTKARIGDSWTSDAPRCFVLVGLLSELDDDAKRRSFELYREHLAGVRVVTYDEVLEQLRSLRDCLASD